MSRALDAAAKATLRATLNWDDAILAYREISTALAEARPGSLLQLEVLGASYPLAAGQSVVRDGAAVGVSKLRLLQAFGVARRMLLDGPHGRRRDDGQDNMMMHKEQAEQDVGLERMGAKEKGEDWEGREEELLRASAVMLLTDPEHLTAANMRKRTLRRRLAMADSRVRAEVVGNERALIDSLLTSHLFRHAKSPTLWSHRRWLAEEADRTGVAWAPLDGEDGELRRVVMVAAERHPRNYYAWLHARWLLARCGGPGTEMAGPAESLVRDVAAWCYRHHSDISGWAFLAAVLMGLRPQFRAILGRRTARLAESLDWQNESVAWFLGVVSLAHD